MNVYHLEKESMRVNDRPVALPSYLSAQQTFRRWQTAVLGTFIGGWLLWLLSDVVEALFSLTVFSTVIVCLICAYKVLIVTLSIVSDAHVIHVTSTDLKIVNEKDLPLYTILVPLYKEARVLPHLIYHLNRLDYPADRLEILLLLEEDDEETIAAATRIQLPSHFSTLIVPRGYPQTKPRACNVGLAHAHGQFVVIYDAEDRPDSDQLKKALIAFQRSREQVICVQSRLNYYNPRQNLLTRLFTLEYSYWFDLLLPGLDATRAPIPLGGTSNHFRISALRAIGGWDSFNVAEDCELGVRLTKAGYRTVTMNSTTWEEANSRVGNWIRQRSRWIKGYLQTYIVHMRDPLNLLRQLGWRNFLSFQLIVGGTPLMLLLTPLMWLLTLVYGVAGSGTIIQISLGAPLESVYPIGLISLIVSGLTFYYFGICGAIVRRDYDLTKFALLTPLYGALQSIAAWKGFFQLLNRPHYWEKTAHGFFMPGLAEANRHALSNSRPESLTELLIQPMSIDL